MADGRRHFHERWTDICQNAGFLPRTVQETGEMSTALALVAAGLGVAIVPEGITQGHRRLLAIKRLPGVTARSQIGIATLAARQTPLLLHLIQFAEPSFRSDV